jgi:hypothetical protein
VVPTEEPSFPARNLLPRRRLDPIERNRAFQVLSPSLKRSVLADRTFTGREDLLEELAASLGAGTATAITQAIAGLGDGRTILAVQYVYRVRPPRRLRPCRAAWCTGQREVQRDPMGPLSMDRAVAPLAMAGLDHDDPQAEQGERTVAKAT